MTRYFDVGVGKVFKFMRALFVVLPFEWEKNTYLNMCVWSKNSDYEVGRKYRFFDETLVVEVDEKLLEKLNSLLDD